MSAPLVVVTGTGTGIGKTHATAALLGAWARALGGGGTGVAGLKPVESGVIPGAVTDAGILEQASTFHVKRFSPPYMLVRAVSPHLAAADEGRAVELQPIVDYVAAVRAEAQGVVVELAGGLFSPLARGLDNADVACALSADVVLLVTPDRLGVLHDVAAATRASRALGLAFTGIVLIAPEEPDASTGTNAAELGVVTDVPVVAVLPRAPIPELAARSDVDALVRTFVRRAPALPL
jgi:dethiobiotin synthetase